MSICFAFFIKNYRIFPPDPPNGAPCCVRIAAANPANVSDNMLDIVRICVV